jgi:hypothetical protein
VGLRCLPGSRSYCAASPAPMFLDRYDVFRAPDVRLPGGRPVFLRCPRGLRRKCLQAMASTAASSRCLIRQKAWQSLAGNVRQSPTDNTAGV